MNKNLLPYDGVVSYLPDVFNRKEAHEVFSELLATISWERDRVKLFGKEIVTKRKVAWYGEPGLHYRYSGTTRISLPWIPRLKALRARAQELSDRPFNSCLLNLYHDGSEGMSWHRDNEKELEPQGCIASFSFGADRRFLFRHRHTREQVEVLLENGSLLLMQGPVQDHWEHRLPPARRISDPRINLTFRNIRGNSLKK